MWGTWWFFPSYEADIFYCVIWNYTALTVVSQLKLECQWCGKLFQKQYFEITGGIELDRVIRFLFKPVKVNKLFHQLNSAFYFKDDKRKSIWMERADWSAQWKRRVFTKNEHTKSYVKKKKKQLTSFLLSSKRNIKNQYMDWNNMQI